MPSVSSPPLLPPPKKKNGIEHTTPNNLVTLNFGDRSIWSFGFVGEKRGKEKKRKPNWFIIYPRPISFFQIW